MAENRVVSSLRRMKGFTHTLIDIPDRVGDLCVFECRPQKTFITRWVSTPGSVYERAMWARSHLIHIRRNKQIASNLDDFDSDTFTDCTNGLKPVGVYVRSAGTHNSFRESTDFRANLFTSLTTPTERHSK